MQYLLLIYANETEEAAIKTEAFDAILREYRAFTQAIIQSGPFKAGDALKPTATATTVRLPSNSGL